MSDHKQPPRPPDPESPRVTIARDGDGQFITLQWPDGSRAVARIIGLSVAVPGGGYV